MMVVFQQAEVFVSFRLVESPVVARFQREELSLVGRPKTESVLCQ